MLKVIPRNQSYVVGYKEYCQEETFMVELPLLNRNLNMIYKNNDWNG